MYKHISEAWQSSDKVGNKKSFTLHSNFYGDVYQIFNRWVEYHECEQLHNHFNTSDHNNLGPYIFLLFTFIVSPLE